MLNKQVKMNPTEEIQGDIDADVYKNDNKNKDDSD